MGWPWAGTGPGASNGRAMGEQKLNQIFDLFTHFAMNPQF